MSDCDIPYLKNDAGVKQIEIGSKKFMCIGATPPLDHPHIFIEMGAHTEAKCPYCGTVFLYNPELPIGAANPNEIYNDKNL